MSAPLGTQSRLALGIVGVGRAGSAMGTALQNAGHRVLAVHAVSQASRERAERWFPDAEVGEVPAVFAASDLVLLTVPDDVLPELAAGVAAVAAQRPGQFVVHASGAHGLSVLEPLRGGGAIALALHPAMTLTGTSVDVQRLAGCPFGVTAEDLFRPIAEALVLEMGGEPVWVPDEARPAYHAALSHAANHLVTLIADAMDVLGGAGIEQPGKLLGPLTAAALDNVLRTGDAALTGPLARGDVGTVRSHLQVLANSPVLVPYLAMARRTVVRALASGRLDTVRGATLLAMLADDRHGHLREED
jgi:predicted short-subunit dehydrogenase-like oxidoreductase (DUF2520 family)